jgi:hypothetical protein
MSDQEHAELDAKAAAARLAARSETEAQWKARARARDRAPLAEFWNTPPVRKFSVFKAEEETEYAVSLTAKGRAYLRQLAAKEAKAAAAKADRGDAA